MECISIIISTYNASSTISDCLKSILNQSYKNYEIIVVDGLSTDNTIDIIKQYSSASNKISFISEKDEGIYDAMNKGIKLSKGEWLYFLGSDDRLYSENVLEKIFSADDVRGYDVIYGSVYNTYLKRVWNGEFNYKQVCEDNMCHQGIFYKKELFYQYGFYDVEMKVYAHVWMDKILFTDPSVKWKYVDEIIAMYDGYGYSSNSMDKKYWKNAEELLVKCFKNKLPVKTIYNGLLPIPRWQFSYHSFWIACKILIKGGSLKGLQYWLNHPYQYVRLLVKKLWPKTRDHKVAAAENQ